MRTFPENYKNSRYLHAYNYYKIRPLRHNLYEVSFSPLHLPGRVPNKAFHPRLGAGIFLFQLRSVDVLANSFFRFDNFIGIDFHQVCDLFGDIWDIA